MRGNKILKIGLIINPVAGIGGKAGLKGSDGILIQEKALLMGSRSEANLRTQTTLHVLEPFKEQIELYTAPGEMGEEAAKIERYNPKIVGCIKKKTEAADTIRIAREMKAVGVDLLLFAGGDGTARDILEGIGMAVPVIGIPAGVKIHSGVYAINPVSAGKLCESFLKGHCEIKEAEVMDLDEDAFRKDQVKAKIYGYMRVVSEKRLLQNPKAGSYSEKEALSGIAEEIVANMKPEEIWLIGSGTTTRAVMERLGLQNTLLGVDVVKGRELILRDVNEQQLYEIVCEYHGPIKLLVTIIGGQGHIFGRGNQQFSPRIIQKVGKENLRIIATKSKIISLQGAPILVDTGDVSLDSLLCGYYRIITGFEDYIAYRVSC